MAKIKECHSPQRGWENVSSHLVHFVERIFFTLGVVVARSPWKTIILTWCFLLLSAVGLLRFHIEKNPMKLWVPPDSDFFKDTNWYIDKFGTGFRLQKLLVTSDNVLDPEVLSVISELSNAVNSIKVKYGDKSYTINDLCYKVPVVNFFSPNQATKSVTESSANTTIKISKVRSKAHENDYSDSTLWLDYDFYCNFLENFPMVCLQDNVLDLWKSDLNIIKNLTRLDIINSVNYVKVNPVTGHPMDFSKSLGGVHRDESGDIIKAESVILTWYTQVNMSDIDINDVGNLVGTEDWVTIPLSMWEGDYLNLMDFLSQNNTNIKLFYEAGRSFGDISGHAIFQELDKLFMGILLMFLYIQFALSRCNWLEVRLTLGSVGLLCVGMAYVTAVSWCSGLGISFGPVHSSLPFLLMGLGVDDMFVMKACWEQLSVEEREKSLPVKVGLMLKHAGVSIVITSFTDVVALMIGAITILPSLKSFCIYAAVGVFFIFCYSVTFYVAVFTLDLKRIESNRNGFLFCYKHKKPIAVSSNKTVFQKIFSEVYKKFFFTTPVKVLVILSTLAVTAFSIEAVLRLEQRFDPSWFIPEGTYYGEFLDKHKQYYPEEGHAAMVFLGEMDYNTEFNQLFDMLSALQNKSYVKDVNSWVDTFHGYVLKNFDHDLKKSSLPSEKFSFYLSRFLFSPVGGRYQINFSFLKPLKCGDPVSRVLASTMSFKFARFGGPDEYIPAMNDVKDIVKLTNITTGDGYRSVWSKIFANWVTDEIISIEVERNIELALLCVMLCTVVLITNLQMCLWIFVCVLLTIVNVLGFMQRWGMTVDIVCCIGLELAIGLCVDYAAHVGHTFLTISQGSRADRAYQTVTSIGTAVLLGGGSTFISLSLLSMSKAYTFKSFFKIFLLVIIFGLFNGLVFLPTMLSLIGPNAYSRKSGQTFESVELNGKSKSQEKQNLEDVQYTEVPS